MDHRPLVALIALLTSAAASAITPEAAQKLMKDVAPSLVAVQYTYDGELGRRDFVGAGLVVDDKGLVMTSIALMPQLLPDEQMKEFKIIIPGDELKEIDAEFIGRDERSNVSFLRAKPASAEKEKQAWKAVKFEEQPLGIGDEVISIGMLGRGASYQAYFSRALVSANLRGENHHVLVTGEGLAPVGSPVFNKDGKAIGWVPMQQGQVITLNDPNPQTQLQSVYAPPRMFLPTREFSLSLTDTPVAGKPLALPWLGVAAMKGVSKDLAEVLNLAGAPAVQIGDVIKGTPADKARL
jgi:S1-C subfamily serine protease